MSAPLFPDLVVNGETVPHTAIAAEAQNHSAPSGKPGIAWRKAASAMAIRTLLLQEARRKGIPAKPEDLGSGRSETTEEALIRRLLETEITVARPSVEEIRTEWARDPDRFRAPPLWEVSHILISCDPRDAKASKSAREQADRILQSLQANPRDFAHIAAEHSDCGSKSAGGALGQLSPGDSVPEFEKPLHSMSEGQISETPVQSRYGWHIIRMDACALGQVLPFETARVKIADALEKSRWSQEAKSYVDRLVAAAEVSGVNLERPVS